MNPASITQMFNRPTSPRSNFKKYPFFKKGLNHEKNIKIKQIFDS